VKSPEELTALFRASGRKVTPQRRRIFELLAEDDTHPSAEQLYQRLVTEMATVSRKTVYQTLWELEALGEIAAVDVGTRSLRFDPNAGENHHHAVCVRCERVVDVAVAIPDALAAGSELEGFSIVRTDVVVRGVCPACRAELTRPSAAAQRRAIGAS
jgi:Fe2+ or Zn2+ uptake regulation protein